MPARLLFLILLLYIALVWVYAAYRFDGLEIEQKGLLWTAIGIGLVLSLILVEQAARLWRNWKSKVRSRPATPVEKPKELHEDDAGFIRLWKEAEQALAQSPDYGSRGQKLVLDELPKYLLIGPGRVGKTATFTHSQLEAHLLAGQVRANAPVANIWIARGSVFIEITGRIYEGDLSRWTEFLKVIRGGSDLNRWKQLVQGQPAQAPLHAVILLQNISSYGSDTATSGVTSQALFVQERLQAVADVFESPVPVYTVFSHADRVKYFEDFFRRLPESEAGQVFGYLLPQAEGSGESTPRGMDAQTRRLGKCFSEVCFRLAERRVLHLTRENNAEYKRGVYEFPREFRRLKNAISQFLTETFHPNPLKTGAVLRGFFFTGKRQVSSDPMMSGNTRSDLSATADLGTTHIFRPEATDIFRPEQLKAIVPERPPSGLQDCWMFVNQLFCEVLLKDAALPPAVVRKAPIDLYRRVLTSAAAAAALLFCLIWFQSWLRNREIIGTVNAAVVGAAVFGPNDTQNADAGPPRLAALQGLDRLRSEIDYLEKDPDLQPHWGLYTGDALEPQARALYFRRFRDVILRPLNDRMVTKLRSLPATPGESAPFDTPYDTLKTHVAITSGRCKADPNLVARVLKAEAVESNLAPEGERRRIVNEAIDYYAGVLPKGNPVALPEDEDGSSQAASYLSRIKSPERIYRAIIEQANRIALKQSLLAVVPDYRQVLLPRPDPESAFTPEGASFVQREAKNWNRSVPGDECLLGPSASVSAALAPQSSVMETAILGLYWNEYITKWRQYLGSFQLHAYRDITDAAAKLDLLSAQRSPILGLLLFSANNTYFPEPETTAPVKEALAKVGGKVGLAKLFDKADKTQQKIEKATGQSTKGTSVEVVQAFQPVHLVVPPGSPAWVTEKGAPYVNGLAELRQSLLAISRSSGTLPDPAVHQQARASYDKAREAVRQVAIGFRSTGTGGVDQEVKTLLEAPIVAASRFIQDNPEKAVAGKLNAESAAFCKSIRDVAQRYPFNPKADTDASLAQISQFFAPKTGLIWKYQQESLGEYVVKQGKEWVLKPDAKVKLAPGVLTFLNRATDLSNAFYQGGDAQPQLRYQMHPAMSLDQYSLVLRIDGREHTFTKDSGLRKDFTWPAATGSTPGASIALRQLDSVNPRAGASGVWGIFRVFKDAEPRPLGSRIVEWRRIRVPGGQMEEARPPVQMSIDEFPGGVDLFNPTFFEGFRCVERAVP